LAESLNLGKIGNIAQVLEDVDDLLHNKLVLLPIQHLPQILQALYNSNKALLKSYFTLGYFGVQNQLDDVMKADIIEKMNDFMQWSRTEVRNNIKINKLADLGQFYAQNGEIQKSIQCHKEMLDLDPNNRIALVALSALYKKLGDRARSYIFMEKYLQVKNNPPQRLELKDSKEEFEKAIHRLQSNQDPISNIMNDSKYDKISKANSSLLEITMETILFVAKSFEKENENKITIGMLLEPIEDIIFMVSEYLPFVSSALYYIMKYGYGTEEQLELTLDIMKDILGYETHQNFEDIDKELLVEYERQRELNDIQEFESQSMAETQKRQSSYGDLYNIPFEYDLNDEIPGYFFVIDYEDEGKRRLMIKPNERVIKSKKITIVFGYPLSKVVKFNYESKKGFTRMDLFKHIYEGYKKIYEEEEKDIGDPGHYKFAYNRKPTHGKYGIWNHYIGDLLIERLSYSKKAKTVEMFIGS